jgi:tRNA pseudouridine55 synthase
MPKLPINGWLIINKPVSTGSTRVVSIVKRFFNAKKVGHAGTLDPLADGVLPIALGEATKTINFAMDSTKEYVFTVKWGAETSTCDLEGDVIATSDKIPTRDEILSILPQFTGTIDQVPPAYSAIKVDGKRAYDLARSGQEVVLKSRKIEIFELELLESSEESLDSRLLMLDSTFRCLCGKGTYIRSLGSDIALKLGTKGHITRLTRTKVGKFCINDAILLEKLENKVYKADSQGLLLPVETVLDDIPVLTFTLEDAKAIRQGKSVIFPTSQQGLVQIKTDNTLVALGEVCEGCVKPVRVFNI